MAYDTIKLKSPSIDRTVMKRIEQQCILRSGCDLATGEVLYELFTGDLLGSWDSRISVIPKYQDWVVDKNGRPRLHACEPYLLIEASAHKVMLGHNVYGGPTDFKEAARYLVALVEKLLDTELMSADFWTVHRVDVAHVFRLRKAACKEFFDSIQLRNFPRRQKKAAKYDMAVYFAGKTTTVKFYHKGSEFRQHDYSRLRSFFRILFDHMFGTDPKNFERVERKLNALQRLADDRLRVEVEIHSDKLQYDFGKNPTVAELDDAYLERIHDNEVERLLREGKHSMETVRNTTAVITRLQNTYGDTRGGQLYGFWSAMCTLNENVVRDKYSRATFFRNRKLLEEAGVSWRSSNIHVTANDSLIHDFTPQRVDRRFCNSPARNRPEYHVSRDLMRLAA
ncbi:phage/plasmid replication protein, II/X family [Variovorax sp. VNK109]|uniref:phage/plasmid replication protein, II/X family n=1 Tax=Variovorax sp. VNK109 TaxID=3400919 RepID=UPI003C03B195